METKTCTKCNEEKFILAFRSWGDKRWPNHINIDKDCKSCRYLEHRLWIKNNSDKYYQSAITNYNKYKNRYIQYRKKYKEKYRNKNKELLNDQYIIYLLLSNSTLIVKDISLELIALKRKELLTKQKIKNYEKESINSKENC